MHIAQILRCVTLRIQACFLNREAALPTKSCSGQSISPTESGAVNRDEFLQQAGGVFVSYRDYDRWNGRDKYENFWAFFFDKDFGWVRSVYGDIPIEKLYQKSHSIEHVVPKYTLQTQLEAKRTPRAVVQGARTNPLNFLAADSGLNYLRADHPFDTDGDRPHSPPRIPLNPRASRFTGLDHESEWVVPVHSRGDVARRVLYMMLVYDIGGLYHENIQHLRRWALIDLPTPWELAFNDWVHRRLRIRNPLCTHDQNALQTILANDILFETHTPTAVSLHVPTQAPIPTPANSSRPSTNPARTPQHRETAKRGNYGVLVGKVEDLWRTAGEFPKLKLKIRTGRHLWKTSLSVRSRYNSTVDPIPPGFSGNELLIYIHENFRHPIVDTLQERRDKPGLHHLAQNPDGGGLDYIRANLFPPARMKLIPSDAPEQNDDIFDRLEDIFSRAQARRAKVYVFGKPYAQGRGIHNVHMNQGSTLANHQRHNGVWQDGGVLVHFAHAKRWVAIFMAFQSQCWHTNDHTGQPDPQGRCSRFAQGETHNRVAIASLQTGNLVRIVSALVNPTAQTHGQEQESVTLINVGAQEVNLTGWHLADRAKRREPLSGVLKAGESRTIFLRGDAARMGNEGGIITLLNQDGLRVHGVSYTKAQGQRQGTPIVFIR